MNKTLLLLGIGLLAGLLLSFALPRPLQPQDPNADPGPEHELLAEAVGIFKIKMGLWLAPGADPITLPGRQESELILGGRFLFSRSVTGPPSDQTESYSIMGYDRARKRYTLASVDSNGTNMKYYEGVREKSGELVLNDPAGYSKLVMTPVEDGALNASLFLPGGKDGFELFRVEPEREEHRIEEER